MTTRIAYLLEKYQQGTCSDAELLELEQWYNSFDSKEDWLKNDEESKLVLNSLYETIAHKLDIKRTTRHKRTPVRLIRWVSVAAAIILVATGAIYLLPDKPNPAKVPALANNDILPGKNQAVLHLGSGKQIILDQAAIGVVSTNAAKTDSGQIVYNSQAQVDELNTLTVPRGGQYKIILADGTKVWLNADTKLEFPVAFTENERRVTLSGEAYFEVAHDATKPFIVDAGSTQTRVLGTHFNINAYSDNPFVKTTLLEGAVQFSTATNKVLLKPNDQASYTNGNITMHTLENAEDFIGWKEGLFVLQKTNVAELMKQIARWYNVAIVYEGAIPNNTLSGEIPRHLNLSSVLKTLELNGIHTSLNGQTITVLSN